MLRARASADSGERAGESGLDCKLDLDPDKLFLFEPIPLVSEVASRLLRKKANRGEPDLVGGGAVLGDFGDLGDFGSSFTGAALAAGGASAAGSTTPRVGGKPAGLELL